MSRSLQALYYLTPGEDAFWRWSSDGSAIEWCDGGTIAFAAELSSYFDRFLGRGVPRIESFLLVLAATRATWPTRSAALWEQLRSRPEHQATLGLLDCVWRAADENCQTSEDRAALLFLLLDTASSRISSSVTQEVIELLAGGLNEEEQQRVGRFLIAPERGPQAVARALRELRPTLEGFSSQRLQLREATGVDELPQAATDEELTPSQRARSLISALQHDEPSLANLARLASQLMSVVSLPRELQTAELHPVGGVSDISNRGTLDRLLISELAHDDLTLALRVAMNEAMYLRRESPPAAPPQDRTILLDVGLRTWGIPRIYIAATGLALLATAAPDASLRFQTLLQTESIPVDLSTKAGLRHLLSLLSPHLHPTDAWEAEVRHWQADGHQELAPVFITTPDTLQDLEFLPRLQPYLPAGLLVATIDRQGHFELTEWTIHGTRSLRKAQFDFESVVPADQTLLDTTSDARLPASLRAQSFPLLLGIQLQDDASWFLPSVGGFCVTPDGRLMYGFHKRLGARQLATGLGELVWAARRPIGLDTSGRDAVYAVTRHPGRAQAYQLVGYTILLGETTIAEFELPDVEAFCEHCGLLFAIGKHTITRVSLADGQLRETLARPPGMHHEKGFDSRYFFRFESGDVAWYCLAQSGARVAFERVPIAAGVRVSRLFEFTGREGAVGLDSTGHLIVAESGERWFPDIGEIGRFQGITRTGDKLVYEGERHRIIDVNPDSGTVRGIASVAKRSTVMDPQIRESFSTKSARVHLSAVGMAPTSELFLRTRKRQMLTLQLVNGVIKLIAARHPPTLVAPFQPVDGMSATILSVASFVGGEEVFLDRRGLLHLKSSAPSIPEATLVLNDAHVAGWLSTGEVFGHEFYHGAPDRCIAAPKVFDDVIRPFVIRCLEADRGN